MGPQLTFTAGLIGIAWWLLSRAFKRTSKAKIFPLDRPLTLREPDELSIISYNVLADNLLLANPMYNYANELFRSWEYRYDKLKDQLMTLDADLVCLQEVEIARWPQWRRFMDEQGYTGILLRRQSTKSGHKKRRSQHKSISNATFFRSRRFKICWEAHCSRVLGLGLKWVDAGGTEHKLYVINVHLEGHPYKPNERAQQVCTIMRQIENDQATTGQESDIVFCGDFNSTRWNAAWQYLYSGRLEGGYTEPYYPDIQVVKETTAHPFALIDTYKSANAIQDFTARAPRRRQEADFIFASRHLKVGAVLRAIDPRQMPYVDRTLLPNKLFPSDHIPIGAVLLQTKAPPSPHFSRQTSTRLRNSVDLDSSFYEGTSASMCSDNENNVEVHASVESLDPHGGVLLQRAAYPTEHHFLDDTALA